MCPAATTEVPLSDAASYLSLPKMASMKANGKSFEEWDDAQTGAVSPHIWRGIPVVNASPRASALSTNECTTRCTASSRDRSQACPPRRCGGGSMVRLRVFVFLRALVPARSSPSARRRSSCFLTGYPPSSYVSLGPPRAIHPPPTRPPSVRPSSRHRGAGPNASSVHRLSFDAGGRGGRSNSSRGGGNCAGVCRSGQLPSTHEATASSRTPKTKTTRWPTPAHFSVFWRPHWSGPHDTAVKAFAPLPCRPCFGW